MVLSSPRSKPIVSWFCLKIWIPSIARVLIFFIAGLVLRLERVVSSGAYRIPLETGLHPIW